MLPTMKVDPRFLTADGPEIFTGNEALLKGALEAEGGMHLLGGYPGSPIAGFFDSMALIKDLLKAKGIRAVINNNEALAAAMLNGSQTIGARAMIAMKSVGVHVAADALALANLAGANPEGGAIVVYGDDPWSDSTQVAADSRYISKHLHIPVFEPADVQEVKDFVDLSLKVSRASELLAGFILTTNLADGGGSVRCRPNAYPDFNTVRRLNLATEDIPLDTRVLLPPRTWWQEESLTDRFARAVAAARRLGVNRILHPADAPQPLGFVTSGLAHGYLVQVLMELGVLGEYPILKYGMSYPIDAGLLEQLAGQCERIIVVEERRGFIEEQISQVLLRRRQAGGRVPEVWGKAFPDGRRGIPATRGLHPSVLTERLVPLLAKVAGGTVHRTWQDELDAIAATERVALPPLPARVASFCPGCPHRDSATVCLEIKKQFMDPQYMAGTHDRGPVDLIFHGDTGCYTMLMYPPNTPLMHDYSGMGLGAGTGSGIDPFVVNKEVVFMGDSTFFHSGQIAISQAIKLGQDITFIILDNRTTAMTGHQPTPGVDYDILGNPTAAQSIDDVIRGMGADTEMPVVRVNPEMRPEYRQLLEKTFLADGVKVIIADKECGITRTRRRRREERAVVRRQGFLPTWEHTNINAEICRFCLACAEATGCPGLKHVDTDYGRKMDTDVTWCVNDGACERVRACSAFERVTIKRKKPPRTRVPELDLDHIPEPTQRPRGDLWRCCLVGVGGMGIGLATSILVRAGHKEGYPVVFVDKKGLAIRNGGVVSQVVYNIAGKPVTGIIPHGKADLLIGVDILEAARALDPKGRTRAAAPDRTTAVINTAKVATIVGLMGQEDFDPAELERAIRTQTRQDDYLARNISRICEKYLGSKLYANIMMLGFAFQKGLIPVSMHSMAWAIKDAIRADFRKNLYAFNMGRKLVAQADLFQGPPQRTGWRQTLDERCRWVMRRYRRGQRQADGLRHLAAEVIEAVTDLPEPDKRAIVVRLYDLMRWGGIEYAARYADAVAGVYASDAAQHAYAATRAVVYNLAAAMLIKDGVFIAELATSPEKYARDRAKYNVNPANGDRIAYRYLLHPEFTFRGRTITLDVPVRGWVLQLLKRSRYLRRLLPNWHRAERDYLAAYEAQVAAFAWSTPAEYHQQLAALSSPRCMNCTNDRCREAGCPLGSDIAQWVQLAYQQRWREAADCLLETNNFPEITSRVCPAPCQDACKQALNGYPVQVREIERQIIDRALSAGWVTPKPADQRTGRRVAIVGSGPAGLAAAQQLVRAGHDVTVFEADPQPGGLLRYGIPASRLDKALVDRRVEQLKAEGVTFVNGTAVGRDVAGGKLREDFDAILLATGARRARDIDVPGRDRPEVVPAMDFLADADAGRAAVADKVVAVIGGGLTGADCVASAVGQGATGVHQFEILPASQVTAAHSADEIDADIVHRRYAVATKALNGRAGRLGIEAVQVQWAASADGPVMTEMPETAFHVDADLAVVATGFDAMLDPDLAGALGVAIDAAGRPVLNGCRTSADGVFVAGDLATGASYVAAAIDSGRQAAERIDAYLARASEPAAATAV